MLDYLRRLMDPSDPSARWHDAMAVASVLPMVAGLLYQMLSGSHLDLQGFGVGAAAVIGSHGAVSRLTAPPPLPRPPPVPPTIP